MAKLEELKNATRATVCHQHGWPKPSRSSGSASMRSRSHMRTLQAPCKAGASIATRRTPLRLLRWRKASAYAEQFIVTGPRKYGTFAVTEVSHKARGRDLIIATIAILNSGPILYNLHNMQCPQNNFWGKGRYDYDRFIQSRRKLHI